MPRYLSHYSLGFAQLCVDEYEGKQGHYASEGMKAYVKNKDTCRRQLLFPDFICFSGTELRTALCKCYDVQAL